MTAGDSPPGGGVAVLLIEDNPGDARLIREFLSEAYRLPNSLAWVTRLSDGLAYMNEQVVDVVLLDLSLPDSQGPETVAKVHEHNPEVPIVVLSGLNDEEAAIETVHQGAQDYLIKGSFDAALLGRAIRYAIERERVRREVEGVKNQIISMVSHELRTPIGHIKGFASSLLDPEVDWDVETRHDFIQEIDREADRLASLVSDILEVSRLEANRHAPLEREPHDPRELVARAIHASEAATAGHTVISEMPDALPSIIVNGNHIERVLINLLENAAKYSPAGSEIRVRAWTADGQTCFSVADQGRGIPAQFQERVFEKFFRLKSPDIADAPGTGLGLAICKTIVESHGGQILLESEVGQGSCFTVVLPNEPPAITH